MLGVLAVLVAACGQQQAGGPVPGPPDPLALVGQWHVDLPGQAEVAAVSVGERLLVFTECGVMDGSWRADGQQSLFVGDVHGGDGSCFEPDGPPEFTWLTQAQRFTVEAGTPVLMDASGARLAVLRPGARPTVGPNRDARTYEAPPSATPELRAVAADPAALPSDADAVGPVDLTGRWVPSQLPADTEAHLAFDADGSWAGSDGCNRHGGRYVLGDGGRLLAVTGGSTSMGCDGAPVDSWLTQAARAGVVSGDLVLYDAAGRELGSLRAADA